VEVTAAAIRRSLVVWEHSRRFGAVSLARLVQPVRAVLEVRAVSVNPGQIKLEEAPQVQQGLQAPRFSAGRSQSDQAVVAGPTPEALGGQAALVISAFASREGDRMAGVAAAVLNSATGAPAVPMALQP